MKNKVNVRMERQEISDEELMRLKDFDSILQKHQNVHTGQLKPWKIIVTVLIIIIALLYVMINVQKPDSSIVGSTIKQDATQIESEVKTLRTDTATVVEDKFKSIDEKQLVRSITQEKKSSVPELGVPQTQVPDSASLKKAVTVNVPPVKQPEAVYVKAEPVNGYTALYEYLGRELIYPKEALKDSIEGVLTVTFLINKLGTPEQIKTSGTLGSAFDKEAIRLVENMPVWKPATINGQPIASKLSLPLTFQLRNRKK